jgi:methionyl-tRNA formyltransferase
MGAALTNRTVAGVLDGTLKPSPQDHSRATYAPILKKEDGNIDWQLPARTIHNRIRGFQPWPGAVTWFRGTSCKILRAAAGLRPDVPVSSLTPGTIVPGLSGKQSLAVVCGDGALLEILELQLPGRKPWPAYAFVNNMQVLPDEKFQLLTDN